MEHGQTLPPCSDPWKTCQVRRGNMSSLWCCCVGLDWFMKQNRKWKVQLQRRWQSCWNITGKYIDTARLMPANDGYQLFLLSQAFFIRLHVPVERGVCSTFDSSSIQNGLITCRLLQTRVSCYNGELWRRIRVKTQCKNADRKLLII